MSLIGYALCAAAGSLLAVAYMSFFALAKRADEQRKEMFAITGDIPGPMNSEK